MKIIEPENLSLAEAMAQIEKWCYESVKDEKGKVIRVDGETVRLPVPHKVKEHLEALYEQMDIDDWLRLAEGYKEIALGKKFEALRPRGRPAGPDYGLGSTERAHREKERAAALGVWHTKYPDGCTECNSTEYAHASGGICNRCRQTIRNAGVSIPEYRRMKAENEKKKASEFT